MNESHFVVADLSNTHLNIVAVSVLIPETAAILVVSS